MPYPFSFAQCLGYVAFLFGVLAFLQKNDKRLKFLNGSQCIFYAVHFALLGNYPAAGSLAVSAARSFLAIKNRSRWMGILFLAIIVGVGLLLVHNRRGWLPIAGGCLATIALFFLRGVSMRLVLLASSFCWLANNLLSGSIGGVMLETCIIAANLTTIARMARAKGALREFSPKRKAAAAR